MDGAGPPPFASILCGVDGSRGSAEAVSQAIRLGGRGASLSFLAVAQDRGTGLVAQAELSDARGREALDEAVAAARATGAEASSLLLTGESVSDTILSQAEDHELVVIGCHGGSRLGGIMLGSTATQVAHRTETPLLVARRNADGDEFPENVLAASDGSPGSWSAVEAACDLARVQASPRLGLVYAPDGTHPERYRQVQKQIAKIEQAVGSPPEVIDQPGSAADRIVEAARASGCSLIGIGRRGVSGIKALGSVSERVVHRAPCSVLVMPAR
ncbi:MAG: universal stress protein, partial [Syntrophothermus sp.]